MGAQTRQEFYKEVHIGVRVPKVIWYQTPKNKNMKNLTSEQRKKEETPKAQHLEVALERLSQYGFQLLNSLLALMFYFFTFI